MVARSRITRSPKRIAQGISVVVVLVLAAVLARHIVSSGGGVEIDHDRPRAPRRR